VSYKNSVYLGEVGILGGEVRRRILGGEVLETRTLTYDTHVSSSSYTSARLGYWEARSLRRLTTCQ
jgi:hypothetical protein